MSMFGPTMCEFNNLKAEHDETRRRLGDLRDQVSMVEGDLIGRLMRRLESLEADTTSVRPIEDAELDSAQFDKEVDETGGVTVFYPVTSPTLNAARSAPAAQPPAVPADVMAAADFLLNDDVGSDLDGLTFVNQSIEHGKTLARYVRIAENVVASPPAGEWTRDVPKEPGWYWWRPKSASAIPQQVYRSHDGDLRVAGFPVGELSGGEWSTTPLQPPAEEILKQASNQIEWYRSLCQCLECGSLCQNCKDSTDIIDALRSVASLPPPGRGRTVDER